jgi:hypothetical protein
MYCIRETRTNRKRAFGAADVLLVLAAILCLGGVGEATNLMVSYAGDDGRAGSLRSTIAGAADGDRIIFHPSISTVSLTDYLFVNKALTIEGPVTIRQTAPGARVLYVTGACTLKNLTITGGSLGTGSGTFGAGVYCYADLTMMNCTVTGNTGGGGIQNLKNLILQGCTISGNSANGSSKAGGIGNSAMGSWNVSLTMTDCVVENNTCSNGNSGGIYNGVKGTLTMARTTVRNNGNSGLGGGMYLSTYATTTLTDHCAVYGNSPDNIRCGYGATYTADDTCTIGSAPNKSATAFSGYSGETEPTPRSIVGDSDVAAVKTALANPESGLYAAIERALATDLGKTLEGKATSLAGMSATLYAANTFEDVSLTSADLSVEYTASWPSNVRYYALFARADGSGYELADRGVQFEIKAGQTLPDGVTPPDFYVPGEGLMTWKNIVTDNGSYDLNPGVGAVTIRVCSVRAAEATGDTGSGGGCNVTGGFAPLALLLAAPMLLSGHHARRVKIPFCGKAHDDFSRKSARDVEN